MLYLFTFINFILFDNLDCKIFVSRSLFLDQFDCAEISFSKWVNDFKIINVVSFLDSLCRRILLLLTLHKVAGHAKNLVLRVVSASTPGIIIARTCCHVLGIASYQPLLFVSLSVINLWIFFHYHASIVLYHFKDSLLLIALFLNSRLKLLFKLYFQGDGCRVKVCGGRPLIVQRWGREICCSCSWVN